MISVLVSLLFEAALRALIAAVAVWTGMRFLRVGNVLVQKAAWGLVLVAALAMPLAPRWPGLTVAAALRLPALPWNQPRAYASASPRKTAPEPAPVVADPSAAILQSPAVLQSPTAAQSVPPQSSDPAAERYPAASRYPAPVISSVDFYPNAQQAPASPEPLRYSSVPVAARQPAESELHPAPIRLAMIGLLVYLGVFAAMLLRLVFGLASALRLWISAKPVSMPRDADPAANPSLRSSPRVASPVNIGSGIILPADYVVWDEEKLRIVLAHERSHVRQGDFYLQLLAGLYASFFWFSPLGWWLKRKLSELSEAISDRAGLEEAASRSSYAQILLEFAALPRPTLTGVAMARTSHLAQRIERLLNESSFRQAFAAGGRRALFAVLLVPVALLASTALVRVEVSASQAPTTQAQPAPQALLAGQSTPEQVAAPAVAPAPAPATATAPTPEDAPFPPALPGQAPAPAVMPAPPAPPVGGVDAGPAPMAPLAPDPALEDMPPMPPFSVQVHPGPIHIRIDPSIRAEIDAARAQQRIYRGSSYTYNDGDPYALVGDPGSHAHFNGDWDGNHKEDIEKARKIAHGHFLWFRHEGKSYVVDDPTVVAEIEAMNKPMDDLGVQMHALGEQMRAFGEQQRDLGKQMRDITIPTPDLSKEIEEMKAAIASFQAKQGGTISQKDLGELQKEVGRIQGEIGALQGKIGIQQSELGGGMGKFGEQQGKLGGEMGKLGAQMGKIARENHEKVNSIIDESLKDGKAKPVE